MQQVISVLQLKSLCEDFDAANPDGLPTAMDLFEFVCDRLSPVIDDSKYPDPPIENDMLNIACQRCAGSGFLSETFGDYDCPRCKGTGREP